jgi:nicotinamidase-related amidase
MVSRPKTNPSFNVAGGSHIGNDVAGLIVDVQLGCICHMAPEDAQNYLSSLAGQITDMRTRGTPVTWATVDGPDNTKFHPPAAGRDLYSMGFYAIAPDAKLSATPNKALFDDFISKHGPRPDEAVFTKPAFNAFATSERDRLDAKIPLDAMPRLNAEHAKLLQHIKSTGADNLAIFGAVGSVCCLETAIGAVQKNINTSLMLDGVVCWRGDGQKSQLVWRDGFENGEDANLWHRSEIRHAPQKPERGFSASEIAASQRIGLMRHQDFIALQNPAAQIAPSVINPAENSFKM